MIPHFINSSTKALIHFCTESVPKAQYGPYSAIYLPNNKQLVSLYLSITGSFEADQLPF